MPSPTDFKGIVASPGYAEGALFALTGANGTYRRNGGAEAEATVLKAAIAQAAGQIAQLMQASGGDSADILEFQLAMLEDEALAEPAFAAITAGADAAAAWNACIDEQTRTYET